MTHARLIATVLVGLLSASTLADGKAFKFTDFSGLFPLQQHEQVAALHLHDGVQRMLIAIRVDLEADEQALWVFPVRGAPADVKVDLVDRFPRFRGKDRRGVVREDLRNLFSLVAATQIYSACLPLPMMMLSRGLAPGIYGSFEKWGIRVVTLAPQSVDEATTILAAEHPAVTSEALAPFAPYCDNQHTLVVAWIESEESLLEKFPEYENRTGFTPGRQRAPTLFVQFPTDTLFYPMKPTASYDDLEMGMRLFILGHVAPQTDPALARILTTRHFQQDRFDDAVPVEFLTGMPREQIPYTSVWAHTAARNFVDDITFVPTTVPGLAYAKGLAPWLAWPQVLAVWLAVCVLFSYLSGGVAGVLVYRRWHRPGVLGLFSILTLATLIIAVRYRNPVTLRPYGRDEPKPRGRRWYVALFSVTFLTLSLVGHQAITAPLR